MKLRISAFALLLILGLLLWVTVPKIVSGNFAAYIEISYEGTEPATVGADVFALRHNGSIVKLGEIYGIGVARGIFTDEEGLKEIALGWEHIGFHYEKVSMILVVPWVIRADSEVLAGKPVLFAIAPDQVLRGGFLTLKLPLNDENLVSRITVNTDVQRVHFTIKNTKQIERIATNISVELVYKNGASKVNEFILGGLVRNSVSLSINGCDSRYTSHTSKIILEELVETPDRRILETGRYVILEIPVLKPCGG